MLTVWTATSVVDWLTGLGIAPGGTVDVELIQAGGPGIWWPDMPDRVAVVTLTSGAGLFMGEGQFDRAEFQLAIRGPQGDPAEAERMALVADELIRRAPTPTELPDGTYLLSVDRGARPTPLERGRDGGRVTYATTYTTEINDE